MATSKIKADRILIREEKTAPTTWEAGKTSKCDIDIAKDGYTVLGIVGVSTNHGSVLLQQFTILSGPLARIYARNTAGSDIEGTGKVQILYAKN